MGFSRQEYWNGLGALLQGIFPTLGSIPSSPTFQADSSPAEPQGKPTITIWPNNSTPEYISKRIKIGIQEVLIVNVHCSIIHNSQEVKTTQLSISIESESEVAQSSPTLSDPMDCCLPASSVHGISQARVPEWAAIAFSVSTWMDKHNVVYRYNRIFFSHKK